MPYIGKTPTAVPLTANDISDGIISTDKLADTSVTNAKLNADLISAETELATAPADTDELLISDAGVLKRIDASLIGGGGITMADMWRVTANITSNADPISSNLERVDDASFSYIGSGMSVSSGTWTFPATGIYLVRMIGNATVVADDNIDLTLSVTTNNSSYDEVAQAFDSGDGSSTSSSSMVQESFVDVTDTSNVKVRFKAGSIGSGSYFVGSSDLNSTSFTFIRLGDT